MTSEKYFQPSMYTECMVVCNVWCIFCFSLSIQFLCSSYSLRSITLLILCIDCICLSGSPHCALHSTSACE